MTNARLLSVIFACSIAWTSAFADDTPIAEQIVDAMGKVFGPQRDGFRANHAKGIVVEGEFKATPEAAVLSKAALFSTETPSRLLRAFPMQRA